MDNVTKPWTARQIEAWVDAHLTQVVANDSAAYAQLAPLALQGNWPAFESGALARLSMAFAGARNAGQNLPVFNPAKFSEYRMSNRTRLLAALDLWDTYRTGDHGMPATPGVLSTERIAAARRLVLDFLDAHPAAQQTAQAAKPCADGAWILAKDVGPAPPHGLAPPNHGKSWTDSDEHQLIEMFDRPGATCRALAEYFGRSEWSILIKLCEARVLEYRAATQAWYRVSTTGQNQAGLMASTPADWKYPEKVWVPSQAPVFPSPCVKPETQPKGNSMNTITTNTNDECVASVIVDVTSPLQTVTETFCFGQNVRGISDNTLLDAIASVDKQMQTLSDHPAVGTGYVASLLNKLRDQKAGLMQLLEDRMPPATAAKAPAKAKK